MDVDIGARCMICCMHYIVFISALLDFCFSLESLLQLDRVLVPIDEDCYVLPQILHSPYCEQSYLLLSCLQSLGRVGFTDLCFSQ